MFPPRRCAWPSTYLQALPVHFVGVWDTVGALGIPFSLMGLFDGDDEFYDNRMGANVGAARPRAGRCFAVAAPRRRLRPSHADPGWNKPRRSLRSLWLWFRPGRGPQGISGKLARTTTQQSACEGSPRAPG